MMEIILYQLFVFWCCLCLLVVGVGALATAFMKARRKAKEFQELIAEGQGEDVKEAFKENAKLIFEIKFILLHKL